MFSKILIANRGEVAVRVIRACKEMGIKTVAIYSDADRDALHVEMADESYCIGGPLVKDSYLNMAAIITVAKKSEAEAIHPGYGMLSENPEFARICEENEITFIGPGYEVMAKMGQKELAREIATKANVPICPGSDLIKNVEEAVNIAKEIGYPVILKARAGGGGKGIRIVREEAELENAFYQVKKEAKSSFADDEVFMEKYLEGVKHVEVQIIADKYGKVLALGDRDCSVQRKNQKLIEECPAPVLAEDVREKMYEAAKGLAKAVGYVTVGTVEFLLHGNDFYFMEMNTRLQVEHSVTEMVCGIDIVEWQIRTAAGVALAFDQDNILRNRHAIECRICAEDSATFTPATGKVELLHVPGGVDVRFDSALYTNYEITPFYDSMLGKLIVCASTRDGAIRKMKSALSEFVLVGVSNNRDIFMKFMNNSRFVSGNYDTGICKKVL
ncbi:acetyl-CoA carboxylase biotin carboxylase subunit [Butyrivibrio sp. DSM 10294]|uniref:acetyl-CoA carboxylase biotin carboxylase subunit n=1 Tax=Butyrivibrio sp. DSM 10294 TaxID=2972457 RepID=UPI00234E9A1C|nr:acetyl-CoA carboxylase biotin carboxylase subunit [Butyrivibrio sp. DSM 10294]MDC7292265.1 acetyl-CoA carboxylase biotin carboxylase subunit [Butyrivibrio sp. DSM 10294]